MKQTQWAAFLRRITPELYPSSLTEAVNRVAELIAPIIAPTTPPPTYWAAGKGWQDITK